MSDLQKMDRKIKAKWLKALRSGKYKQGRSYLRQVPDSGRGLRHCCLGVLAEVSGVAWKEVTEAPVPHYFFHKREAHTDDWYARLPPSMVPKNAQEELIDRNDSGETFKRIANWIERNL